MYVCVCYGVTDKQVKQAVDSGAVDLKSLQKALNVGTQCGKCIKTTLEVMQQQLDVTPNYYEVA
ncbi:bacterioferritin-associated ferredoxin [Ferrimonas balearica]|uniref:bacterioferritin-associated ferredoxin n=1 Tax=Ferrimonas balearica TaxID=44012 RepID=UPI001C589D5A|nr:bacterioferritin-associated ferredoxin [Ferrimonas balearica]MBY6018669.1 bacterioferritin-associated ferredoxin [Halomonas denitrificans]MBW3140504.1 bacterioferritin-associated ferredoxin [Ferrimonas balearica]MBW3165502.1 bacterioferritin-associated ferredoxin [Ferrimonas balearica]MBY5981284.1 bacterioferritin-associated ferredoxin [Ferrimonas balearica]MBY6096378.1 bacterioferritin-associated ferredoxin [Ferrimonas balearica]